MNSLGALVLLALAPAGMVLCHWHGRRAERRTLSRNVGDEAEHYLIARNR